MARVCGESTSQVKPKWYDPLGPTGFKRGVPQFGTTGGPEQREAIFSQLANLFPAMQDSSGRAASYAETAADNPGYGAARDLATRELRGEFLNGSPALNDFISRMRAQNVAEGENAAARMRSQYQSNGLPWSTANQQAQQAAQAAGTAKADATEAATRLANYQNERGMQQNAVDTLNAGTSAH